MDRLADADRVRLRSFRPQAARGAAATYYRASHYAPPTMRRVHQGWLTAPRPCPPPCPPGVLPLQAERCCGCCGHDARRCGCWGGRHRGGHLGVGQARRRPQASDAAEAAPAEPCGEPGASRRRAGSPAWQGQREGQGQWRQLGGRAGSVVCGNLSISSTVVGSIL